MYMQVQGSTLENILDGTQITAGSSNLADTCLCEPLFFTHRVSSHAYW